ncbi:hypothetical protein [Nocardia sp. XZ_19_385]|uniref:hypothetical protein n=1 Tax=Nocardia sp. XZ_19_385 TaxID=2769488 RepID=UPI00188FE58C|nr:hypothetical protein [Nocardia sp. XZ_19_385]
MALSAGVGVAAVATAPTAAAHSPIGSCYGGEFRWTAVEGGITMTPQLLTFGSAGRLWGCEGVSGITHGKFTGVHVAWSDCMHPADGPLTVDIVWSNGEASKLWGPWPVGMMQPTVGQLQVVDGVGEGSRVQVNAWYEMMTPEQINGCMGPGISTGVGRMTAEIVE